LPTVPGFDVLSRAVAEVADVEGVLLLVEAEIEQKRPFVSHLTIKNVLYERVRSENMTGAFNLMPVPAADLRQRLLAMTTDGGSGDVAARYLRQVDELRDDFGALESDPRHPDLASGREWPLVPPTSNAQSDGNRQLG